MSIPTGYGKSLCYALLPFIFDVKRGLVEKKSIAMVVSPLIALMKIQSGSFTRKSITRQVDIITCLIIELHQNPRTTRCICVHQTPLSLGLGGVCCETNVLIVYRHLSIADFGDTYNSENSEHTITDDKKLKHRHLAFP